MKGIINLVIRKILFKEEYDCKFNILDQGGSTLIVVTTTGVSSPPVEREG